MPRQKGVFASLLAELGASAEPCEEREHEPAPDLREDRGTAPEVRREDRRPAARSRSERMQALKGRRLRLHRPSSDFVGLDELDEREESLETRCVRPSLRFQAHVDVVVTRAAAPGEARDGVELHEVDPGEGPSWPGGERASRIVEVERVRLLKPAGVAAHLQILDRALVGQE